MLNCFNIPLSDQHDGCLFDLEPRASDSKPIKNKNVTIRRPTAVKGCQEAAFEPGAAAQMGERVDKDEAREQPRGCAGRSEDDLGRFTHFKKSCLG